MASGFVLNFSCFHGIRVNDVALPAAFFPLRSDCGYSSFLGPSIRKVQTGVILTEFSSAAFIRYSRRRAQLPKPPFSAVPAATD